jgi:DNA-binding response OmpR family regulator
MPSARRSYVIAYSSQPSVADLLQRVLDEAGFASSAVWSSPDDLESEVRRCPPAAIVFDVGIPFAEHWRGLQQVRSRVALRGVPVVIATAAPPEVYRSVGVVHAFDTFRRPNDVATVRATVCAAIDAAPAHVE